MSRNPRRSRKGFTLIELLVVIAIIGVLIGLLLPAVQRIRENANQLKCKSNMRNLVLACQSANTQYGRLPPLANTVSGDSIYAGQYATIFFHLFPFLEEGSTHALGYAGGVQDQKVNIFLCPSDSSASGGLGQIKIGSTVYGLSNYGANYLVFGAPPFSFAGSTRHPDDIPDGVTKTIYFAEKNAVCQNGGSTWWNIPLVPATPAVASDADGQWGAVVGYGGYAASGTPRPFVPYYGDVATAGSGAFQTRNLVNTYKCNPYAAQTAHGDSMNVAMGDGSVQSINWSRASSDTPATSVWKSLLTPNGNERIPGDWNN